MIPPCGVPLSLASINSPLCMYPAFNQELRIGLSEISNGALARSHLCDILSNKPFISKAYLSIPPAVLQGEWRYNPPSLLRLTKSAPNAIFVERYFLNP